MGYLQQMRYVVLPQALRIAVTPTVGVTIQIVKMRTPALQQFLGMASQAS
jgi:ABC-type amino acid transport system permease subunit